MPGIIYNQREIILLPFPYSDLNAAKKRPALIISHNLSDPGLQKKNLFLIL
jgi:hypothetical protein